MNVLEMEVIASGVTKLVFSVYVCVVSFSALDF